MTLSRRLVPAMALFAAIGVTTAATPAAPARAERLDVIEHSFAIATGSPLTATISLPAGLTGGEAAAASFEITSYERVDGSDDVQRVLAGELPRAIDATVVPASGIQLGADATTATLSVLVDALNTSTDTLQFSRPGVYPISIDVIAGERRGRATTFVHRADTQPDVAINVAMVVGDDVTATIDASGTVTPASDAPERLSRLADVLSASRIPLGVDIDPSVVAAVAADDPTLTGRLATAAADDQLLSAPAPPLDPSAAVAAGATDVYTEWLRAGEDSFGSELGVTARRAVDVLTAPMSTAAATMRRDLGTRLLVITPSLYDGSDGSLGVFTDTSQLIGIALSDGGRLPAAVIDRVAADALASSELTVDEQAAAAAAVVLAHRQGTIDRSGDPTRHSVIIGLPDGGAPDPELTGRLTELLATTGGVRPITPDQIVDRTEALLFDGRPLTIELDEPPVVDLTPRLTTRDELDVEAAATASMLVDDTSGTFFSWVARSSLLPSTALADDDADALAAGLRSEYAALRQSVELPTPFSFTITGGENTIPLRFTNLSDQTLRIRVRLIAPRLIVPGGDTLVDLAPNGVTTLDVEVRTRSNGRSPVSLDVFTPEGDLRIGERVPLTARVTILAGVGNLVTGVAAVMLLTWWFRHWRRNRQLVDEPEEDDDTTTLTPS